MAVACLLGATALLGTAAFASDASKRVAAAVLFGIAVVALSWLWTRWRNLLALLVLVILFVPIKRYELPGSLPFDFELYRLVAAVIVLGWGASLLVDRRVRLRQSGLEWPLLAILLSTIASEIVNPGRVAPLASDVLKQFTFLLSFLLVFYVIVSVVRTRADVDFLIRVLVAGGGVVAGFALVERRTGFNVFDHLSTVIPLLRLRAITLYNGVSVSDLEIVRGGQLRVVASSQHPIALGVLFAVLMPLALYLARREGRRRWLIVAVMLLLGLLATASRTGIVSLFVIGLVFLVCQPRAVVRLLPALVPLLLAVQIVLPGTLSATRDLFFPKSGLIASQTGGPLYSGSGRLAKLRPALHEWADRPVLGEGFSTRVPTGPSANTRILDDQWLDTLLETGLVGAAAWLWLFVQSVGRFARAGKQAGGDDGWLLTALAGTAAAFGVAMLTYDAFGFIQTFFVFFILLALGAALMNVRAAENASELAASPDSAG